ncbi:hypothetical protein WN55_03805 [Dufourea novaeangliae]|uniref:Kazal-like domain-containing protein n=1 Tax=Dufourea novaeangliae TaxID=178035 RepID=A0A154PK86_DUFNO|nr:hypothetical protein WN55_03805 [Dufourea novaeangliae]
MNQKLHCLLLFVTIILLSGCFVAPVFGVSGPCKQLPRKVLCGSDKYKIMCKLKC